jgi:hypothetical protein
MRFRYEYMSLTQIGQVFGTTSHQVGRWLLKLGLRTQTKQGMKPSAEAFEGGYVKDVPSRGQGYVWAWHSEKTVTALEKAGHWLCISPSSELLAACVLNGPFQHRRNHHAGFEIVNGDGTVAITVVGEQNARFLWDVLNAADRRGVISRVLGRAGAPVTESVAEETSDGETE